MVLMVELSFKGYDSKAGHADSSIDAIQFEQMYHCDYCILKQKKQTHMRAQLQLTPAIRSHPSLKDDF